MTCHLILFPFQLYFDTFLWSVNSSAALPPGIVSDVYTLEAALVLAVKWISTQLTLGSIPKSIRSLLSYDMF